MLNSLGKWLENQMVRSRCFLYSDRRQSGEDLLSTVTSFPPKWSVVFGSFLVLCPLLLACQGDNRPLARRIAPTNLGDFNAVSEGQLNVENSEMQSRLFEERSSSNVIDLRFVFSVGSAHDPAGKFGITSLTVNALARGGAGKQRFEEILSTLFPFAVAIESHVGREQSTISFRFPVEGAATVYPVVRNMLQYPHFDPTDVDRLRAQALFEIQNDLKGSNEEELSKEVLQTLIYPDHPYGHPVLGHRSQLKQLSASDLRSHYRDFFCTETLSIGIAGAVPFTLKSRILSDFANWTRPACRPPKAIVEAPKTSRKILIVEKKDASAVSIAGGFALEGNRASATHLPLRVVASYLGEHRQFVGRLMQLIREDRGLNYGDYAYAEHFEQQGWSRYPRRNIARVHQYFSFWLRPLPVQHANFALRLAMREIRRVKNMGLRANELKAMQSFLSKYYTLFSQSQSERVGDAIDARFYGRKEPLYEQASTLLYDLDRKSVQKALQNNFSVDHTKIVIVAANAKAMEQEILARVATKPNYGSKKDPHILAEDQRIASYPLGFSKLEIQRVSVQDFFE